MNFMRSDHESSLDYIKPLSASDVFAGKPILKEPKLLGDFVLWLEQRPDEGGRTTLLIRPWMKSNLKPQELTPFPINLRTSVHGYGGGVFSIHKDEEVILISWIDNSDGCLWLQSWSINKNLYNNESNYLNKLDKAFCLSSKSNYSLADGIIDFRRNRWLGIMEQDQKDYVVEFLLDKEFQKPFILYNSQEFIGYLSLNPNANYLAWIEWQNPFMPWDSNQLKIGKLDEKGLIVSNKIIAGQNYYEDKLVSVFQPIWLRSGEIVISEDKTGWWNVMIGNSDLGLVEEDNYWQRLWPMEADSGMPQWVLGMSTIAESEDTIIALSCRNGSWELSQLFKDGTISVIDQPFTDFVGLVAQDERVVAIAGNSCNNLGLFELNLRNSNWEYTNPSKLLIVNQQISSPKSFWFKGYQDEMVHSWYYPPIQGENSSAPLLVKSHSGPTGMAKSSLNLEIQFWTSRGWGVVDVNYGGSTGFGREYRERLNNHWGEVDVFDCVEAAKSLIEAGKADEKYVAIEGGSAGGFTTLGCLCSSNIFKVAACRYPVSDLISMIEFTHRFEKYYFDSLLGSYLSNKKIYADRSPLNNVHKINSPIIFFQGLKDNVVLHEQTNYLVEKLKSNNIPVEFYTFQKEGHGFKDGQIKINALELTEKFFQKHLGF